MLVDRALAELQHLRAAPQPGLLASKTTVLALKQPASVKLWTAAAAQSRVHKAADCSGSSSEPAVPVRRLSRSPSQVDNELPSKENLVIHGLSSGPDADFPHGEVAVQKPLAEVKVLSGLHNIRSDLS